MSQSWTVTVNNRSREIRVDEDDASGKAFVRVDGRIATRPMLRTDEDCEFLIDGVRFRVMRHGVDGFALDDAPPPAVYGARTGAGSAKKSRRMMGGVAAVIGFLCVIHFSSYAHMLWFSFDGDGYTIDFPKPPSHSSTPIGALTLQLDVAEFRRHGYGIGWFDLPGQLDIIRVPRLLNDIADKTMEKEHGTLASRSLDRYMGRPAVYFAGSVGETDAHRAGKMQGRVIISRYQRVYLLYTFVPENDDYTADADHFMNSLKLTRDETMQEASQSQPPPNAPNPNDPNSKRIEDLRREENERALGPQPQDHRPHAPR